MAGILPTPQLPRLLAKAAAGGRALWQWLALQAEEEAQLGGSHGDWKDSGFVAGIPVVCVDVFFSKNGGTT